MKKGILTILIGAGLAIGSSISADAATYYNHSHRRYRARRHYAAHRRHVRTARRVGVGAAGGAAIGALAGGGKGAAIGAAAGAGALYDQHKRAEGK